MSAPITMDRPTLGQLAGRWMYLQRTFPRLEGKDSDRARQQIVINRREQVVIAEQIKQIAEEV